MAVPGSSGWQRVAQRVFRNPADSREQGPWGLPRGLDVVGDPTPAARQFPISAIRTRSETGWFCSGQVAEISTAPCPGRRIKKTLVISAARTRSARHAVTDEPAGVFLRPAAQPPPYQNLRANTRSSGYAVTWAPAGVFLRPETATGRKNAADFCGHARGRKPGGFGRQSVGSFDRPHVRCQKTLSPTAGTHAEVATVVSAAAAPHDSDRPSPGSTARLDHREDACPHRGRQARPCLDHLSESRVCCCGSGHCSGHFLGIAAIPGRNRLRLRTRKPMRMLSNRAERILRPLEASDRLSHQ